MAAASLLALGSSVMAQSSAPPDATALAPSGSLLEAFLFYAIGGATVFSALAICFTTNIVRMAVWLMVTLVSIAMLYFLLSATFIGAIQLIVYAGGTLVLLIFGVMLTSKSPWVRFTPSKVELFYAALVCGALTFVLGFIITKTVWPPTQESLDGVTVAELGRSLMTTYVVPFEIIGVLLMVVMVGAAYLARQEKSSP